MIHVLTVMLVVLLILWIVPMLIQLAKERSLSRLLQSLCNLVTGSLVLLIAYFFRSVYLYLGRESLFIDFIDAVVGILLIICAGVLVSMISTYYESYLLPRFINFTRIQCMALCILRFVWLLFNGLTLIDPILIFSLIGLVVTYMAAIPYKKAGHVEL